MASTSRALVLQVGHDLMLLHTRGMVLKSAGHIVECEYSIEDAVRRFLSADFDLVLLCHSLSDEERQRFIRRIREYGSCTPVLSVGLFDTLNARQGTFDEPKTESSPLALLNCIDETLQKDRSAQSTQRHSIRSDTRQK